jgi:hypothetical protein
MQGVGSQGSAGGQKGTGPSSPATSTRNAEESATAGSRLVSRAALTATSQARPSFASCWRRTMVGVSGPGSQRAAVTGWRPRSTAKAPDSASARRTAAASVRTSA